jgi:hypothetical protein
VKALARHAAAALLTVPLVALFATAKVSNAAALLLTRVATHLLGWTQRLLPIVWRLLPEASRAKALANASPEPGRKGEQPWMRTKAGQGAKEHPPYIRP